MNDILISVLLILSIAAVALLIINLVRSYRILTDLSQASDSIKKSANAFSQMVLAWKDSVKTVTDFTGEIVSYLNFFKKFKNNNKKESDDREK